MKATLVLADSCQKDQAAGKLHALGAGWNLTPAPTPPMALMAFIDCPWDQTNQKHKIVIELVDSDGHVVTGGTGPLGNPEPAVRIEAEIEVERPPGVTPGSPIREFLALNLPPGMPVAPDQTYEFRMTINGKPVDGWLARFQTRPAT